MSLAGADLDKPESAALRWAKRLALALLLAAAVIGLGLIVKGLASGGKAPKRPARITIIPDTPPPPPPPPKPEEKKREEKEVKQKQNEQKQEIKQPQPEPQQLKMEGAAGDGPSPFSSGDVKSDYKGGDIGTAQSAVVGGGNSSVNRLVFNSYAAQIQSHIQEVLAKNPKVKYKDYRVSVRVWVSPEGIVQKAQLSESTGDDELDASLSAALSAMPPMRQLPPQNMPQPVRLRISNRLTG